MIKRKEKKMIKETLEGGLSGSIKFNLKDIEEVDK
jgi:hypothetical protein